ncbi:Serine/threonine-protein kinase PknD [compost metagenome]
MLNFARWGGLLTVFMAVGCAVGPSTLESGLQDPCRPPTGLVDGPGPEARFWFINAVAADANGNLFLADNLNHRLRKVAVAGDVTTFAGSSHGFTDGPALTAKMASPNAVAVDGLGTVYFWDSGNHRIRKVSSGHVSSIAGKFSTYPDGVIGGYADGKGEDALFSIVYGMAVNSVGEIFVTDYLNHRIRKISPDGDVTTFAGSGPIRVGPDEKWGGYVDGPGSIARFNQPQGIAIDTSGNLYVADSGNNRIRKVSPAGEVTTLAGTGEFGGADGEGAQAQLSNPWAITVDGDGNVYVLEPNAIVERRHESRIRKISSTGLVSTVTKRIQDTDPRGGYTGLAASANGKVYVSDLYSVFELTDNGEGPPIAGMQPTCVSSPSISMPTVRSPWWPWWPW